MYKMKKWYMIGLPPVNNNQYYKLSFCTIYIHVVKIPLYDPVVLVTPGADTVLVAGVMVADEVDLLPGVLGRLQLGCHPLQLRRRVHVVVHQPPDTVLSGP